MSVDFSIVLINFNSAAYIEPCLDHIRRQNFKGTTELIVVNNLSADGSLDILKNQSDIILLDSGKNIGYSRGNNLGISRSRGKYILCLNFDCLLTEDFLQRVYEAFEAFPHVGMISGKLRKLVDMQPTIYLDSTGIDFTTLIPADRGECERDKGQYDTEVSIFGPSGAAGCYRREALESVVYRKRQYFDEQMFAYCEDIDLSWRLNLAGWKGLYVPGALAFHERGVTRKDSLWKRVGYYSIGFSNRYFTILKNLHRKDIKGHVGKLLRQEWRFISSWCGMRLSRWVVAGYVTLRLAGLVFRPSFFAKRQLAHIHGKGEHLDLSMDTDYWLKLYKKHIQEPLHMDYEGDSGSGIIVDKQAWLVSVKGFRNELWGKDGFFSGTITGGQAFIEIHIPEEYQEKANSMQLYIDLDAGTDISAEIQVFPLDGKQARSNWNFLSGGRGLYKFDLEKMDLKPGLGNIQAWQGRWGTMKLNLSCGPSSKVDIRKMFFGNETRAQPRTMPEPMRKPTGAGDGSSRGVISYL